MYQINLWAAWVGIFLGLLSGAAIGLRFHEEAWLGGYGTWPRRMLRLGHISFFGVAFLNLAFVATVYFTGAAEAVTASSVLLVAGAVLMPTVCFLSAWQRIFRHLFFLPVLSLLAAVGSFLIGGYLP